MSILKNRMYNQLEFNQGREEAGFRRNFSTIDNIFSLNQILEKSIEYNLGVQLLPIDFKKAFDCIEHEYIWRAMVNQGINEYWIRILKNIWEFKGICETNFRKL